MKLHGIASTGLILLYAAGTVSLFFASLEIGYVFTAIASAVSFLMIFFTPAFWNKTMRIKYWKMCTINISIILIAIFTETAFKTA